MVVFDFGPFKSRRIIEDSAKNLQLGKGWNYGIKPRDPIQPRFEITLQGMKWFVDVADVPENTTEPARNMLRFIEFYESHRMYANFDFVNPHTGITEKFRFTAPPEIPQAYDGGSGLVPNFSVYIERDMNQ